MQNSELSKNVKKILILRLSALGDTIHTLPLANAIKSAYPDCKIGWVVEDKAQFFVKDNPLVDYCYVLPKKQWKNRGFSVENIKEFFDIVKNINNEGFDAVLDTQQLFKSAMLLPFLKIKRKITLSGGREFSRFFSNEIYEASHDLFDFHYHVVNRNLEFAEPLGIKTKEVKFVIKESSRSVQAKVAGMFASLDKNKKTAVLAPATTWENKHWAEKNWSEVLDYLNGKTNIIITGTNADDALCKRIIDGSTVNKNDVLWLVGQTNLEELAEVFRRSDVVVSPDSGSAHIAWAVSNPAVVTIFSATAEGRCAPFGENCYVLAPKTDCRPCMKRKCRYNGSEKNKCCKLLSSNDLIKLLKEILQL